VASFTHILAGRDKDVEERNVTISFSQSPERATATRGRVPLVFDKKITQRLHIETVATEAYGSFIRLYSLFKSDRISTNSRLTFHKALIMSIMTYVWPAWEFTAHTHLMKLQRLQNKVLRTIGNFPRNTPIHDMHISFQIPYVYDYIIKLCRQQAQVIQHHENTHVRNIRQDEVRYRKYKKIKLGGGQAYDRSSD
jgi:hypothetical protein